MLALQLVRRCVRRLSPDLPVKGAVLDGFAEMGGLDAFVAAEIKPPSGAPSSIRRLKYRLPHVHTDYHVSRVDFGQSKRIYKIVHHFLIFRFKNHLSRPNRI